MCGVLWCGGTWLTTRILGSGEVGHSLYRHFEDIDMFTWMERWWGLYVLGSWAACVLIGTTSALAALIASRRHSRLLVWVLVTTPIVVSLVVGVLDIMYGHPPIE